MTRVLVTGAAGRMGKEAALAIAEANDLEQVGAVDTVGLGEEVSEGIVILQDLAVALADSKPDVLFDVTHFSAAVSNAVAGLDAGANVVIGTSGIDQAGRDEIAQAAERAGRAALIVPNFALGAVLMMAFAEQAAKWMPSAEIIERHGNHKKDAPSGTAAETAARIALARTDVPAGIPGEEERVTGARG
ncbi:MAG: 4-hydroxy-tetrahydrodipicolinate reductase, partial [Fimbriimonadaceae bacterium]|nr:4-hydroxy-tetrahydrodipicolinate reductase [Fimbriimonadaceae bacterium]